ncbi:MAG: protein kinase [Planctomycetales bacterium]
MIDDNRHLDPALANDPSVESLAAEVADDFTDRLAQGERPDVEEYVRRHPRLASVLRDLLPALRLMHQSGSGILSDSETPRGGTAAAETLTGCLGDYRLLREVGRGGMGIVYEAEQISLGRRVALKVLPFAAALDAKQLERFKREAQAAAHLHHTNIVPVYSVGCERGVYYYAMQFIEGQSLAGVIAELRRLAGEDLEVEAPTRLPTTASEAVTRLVTGDSGTAPRSRPADRENEAPQAGDRASVPRRPASPTSSPTGTYAALSTQQSLHAPGFFRSVAMLGVQAAEALEHAHGLGIVHRDVKPANLLVDAGAHLWVTDFGLARYQEDANLTRTGDMVGTLRYMSPEQALGHRTAIDHRTDIYSLGATLYELLTGRPVWDGSDRRELLRQIAFDEPLPPRKWDRLIPVDLQNILLKTLAREPHERYATAGLVAADLRRFLEDKPVLARRPTLRDRAGKWARRHRGAVATAIALLVLAVIGLTVSNVMIAREQSRKELALTQLAAKQALLEREQEVTKQALAAEERERERAEWNYRQARQVLGVLVEVAEEDLARTPGAQDVRRKILEWALLYHQEFLKHAGDDPAAVAEIADSLFRVARIFNEIDAKPDAHIAYEAAREIQERLAREHPDDAEIQIGLFAIYRWLGVLQGSGELSVLTQESVREHLQLDAAQIARIDELAEERRNSYRNFFALRGRRDQSREDREELEKLFGEQAREAQAQIAGILTPAQAERLRQIALQLRGTQAFGSPDLSGQLGLTAAQQLRIHDVKEQAARDLREIFRGQGAHRGERDPGRDPEARKIVDVTRRTTNEKLLSVLTVEQRGRWLQLLGEPFVGELRFGPRGRFQSRDRGDRDEDSGAQERRDSPAAPPEAIGGDSGAF